MPPVMESTDLTRTTAPVGLAWLTQELTFLTFLAYCTMKTFSYSQSAMTTISPATTAQEDEASLDCGGPVTHASFVVSPGVRLSSSRRVVMSVMSCLYVGR
jgi:hypothetical protein